MILLVSKRHLHPAKKIKYRKTFSMKQMTVKIAEHGQTLIQYRTAHNINAVSNTSGP
jgi:hypothetical protein